MKHFQKLCLLTASILCVLVFSALPADACSITSGRKCGGSPCPKGETCKKTSATECDCVSNAAIATEPGLGECERANATLDGLLGSSSEEIRLHAALGLLSHGCASRSIQAAPGCVEPADAQYKACRANCKANSPQLQECHDGCVDVFGAVLERCAEGANVARNDCHDCLSSCAESRYECFESCRDADPWDPDCYDECDEIDCDEECESECSR